MRGFMSILNIFLKLLTRLVFWPSVVLFAVFFVLYVNRIDFSEWILQKAFSNQGYKNISLQVTEFTKNSFVLKELKVDDDIELKQAKLDYSFLNFINNGFALDAVYINGLKAKVDQEKFGNKQNDETSGYILPTAVKKIIVKDSHIYLVQEGEGVSLDIALASYQAPQERIPGRFQVITSEGSEFPLMVKTSIIESDNKIDIKGNFLTSDESLKADFLINYQKDSQSGDGFIEFDTISLNKLPSKINQIIHQNFALKNLDGKLDLQTKFNWEDKDIEYQVKAKMDKVSFKHNEFDIQSLSSFLTFTSFNPLVTEKNQYITIEKIEGPVPLEDVFVQFDYKANGDIYIQNAQASLFDGRIMTEGYKYNPGKSNWQADVKIEEINLEKLLDYTNYKDLQMSGSLSGVLPLIYKNNQLLIEKASLKALDNGYIRFKPSKDLFPNKNANPHLKLFLESVENYRYKDFEMVIDKNEEQVDKLSFYIKGESIKNKQPIPVNLNVNFETDMNKIWKIIQSLSAIPH